MQVSLTSLRLSTPGGTSKQLAALPFALAQRSLGANVITSDNCQIIMAPTGQNLVGGGYRLVTCCRRVVSAFFGVSATTPGVTPKTQVVTPSAPPAEAFFRF